MKPSLGTVVLVVRITGTALAPVVTRGDLRALKHLPFVLTHLDDAAVVGGALSDPVGTAVRAPGGIARAGFGGLRSGSRMVGGAAAVPGRIVGLERRPSLRQRVAAGPVWVVSTPVRVIGGPIRAIGGRLTQR